MKKMLKTAFAALLIFFLVNCGVESSNDMVRNFGVENNSEACGSVGMCAAEFMSVFPDLNVSADVVNSHISGYFYPVSDETDLSYSLALSISDGWIEESEADWGRADFDCYFDIDLKMHLSSNNTSKIEFALSADKNMTFDDLSAIYNPIDSNISSVSNHIKYESGDYAAAFRKYRDLLISKGVFAAHDCTEKKGKISCHSNNNTESREWVAISGANPEVYWYRSILRD